MKKDKLVNIQKLTKEILEHDRRIPYTQMSNKVIQNITSIEAGFIWVYLQTLPASWEVNRTHIKNKFNIGNDKLDDVMSFLNKSNLIEYKVEKNIKGQYLYTRVIVKCGIDFVQVKTKLSKIVPDNFLYEDDHNENPQDERVSSTTLENQGVGSVSVDNSTPLETTPVENHSRGFRKHINKTFLTKKTSLKTGTGFSKMSEKEKRAMYLLRSKFSDNRITLKQTRQVLELHSDKVDLEWSINNYLYDLQNSEEVIRNKIGVFTKRLESYISNNANINYYPDNKVYTKCDEDNQQEDEQKSSSRPFHQSHKLLRDDSGKKINRESSQVTIQSLIAKCKSKLTQAG